MNDTPMKNPGSIKFLINSKIDKIYSNLISDLNLYEIFLIQDLHLQRLMLNLGLDVFHFN